MNNNLAPAAIGHYQIIRQLGLGGLGTVYLAFDPRLERQVAVKCIPHNGFYSRGQIEQEARLLARLNSANAVQIYDVVEQDSQLSLIMEYVDGQTLARIQTEQSPPLGQKLIWLGHIAQGLASAHNIGVIHNDLKAENILIDSQGTAKIADFGIAKLHNETINLSSEISGSCYAMSPEQIAGEITDHRSDLFSFGILAFTLLCGRHPFANGGTALQVMQSIRNARSASAIDLQPELPQELSDLLSLLLQKDLEKRPQSAQWLVEQLAGICSRYGLSGSAAIVVYDPSARAALAPSSLINNVKSKKLAVMGAVVGFCAAAIGYWWFTQPPSVRYVALMPPHIESKGALLPGQQALVAATVYDALSQGIIHAKQLALIAKSEVDNVKGDNKTLAHALAADDIISSEISCSKQRCELSLSRLSGERMTVVQQAQWPTITDSMLEIFYQTQGQLNTLYIEQQTAVKTLPAIEPAAYHTYIQIYNRVKLKEQVDKADLRTLERLLTESPDFYPVYNLYRSVTLYLYQQTNKGELLAAFAQLLKHSSARYKNTVPYAINRYWLAIVGQDIDKAKAELVKAKNLGAGPAIIHELEARVYLSNNEIKLAVIAYKKALRLRPGNKLYYNLALCYWWLGDTEQSKNTLDALFERYPEDNSGQQLLASIYLSEGNLSSAITTYQALVKINPLAINLNNLGLGYMLNQELQQAFEQFTLAVAKEPDKANWLLNLADSEQLLGLRAQAQQHYNQVIQMNQEQDILNSWLERSQAFAHLGLQEEAIRALHRSQKLAPDNPEIYFNAALIYTLVGEHTSALVQVQNALENDIGVVWFNLPWFDQLCMHPQFRSIMIKEKLPQRCE